MIGSILGDMIPLDRTLQHLPNWEAELALEFECRDRATCLAGRRHRGPLRVQKALRTEGGMKDKTARSSFLVSAIDSDTPTMTKS